ncbi:MAG: polysaccharide biosynthesis C-terminal domain-containing protein [Bacteroidales bacterium]|nr:polysaccharide biosynthesis C-terminal domain-containing protein [Bacteroidales bacterium]
MGFIAKQSIKGATANYIGVALGFFITFFVLTDCLTQAEIGLTRVMVDAAMLFSALAQIGSNSSIMRFFPRFKDGTGANHGIFGLSLLIPLAGFVLFAVLFLIFKDSIVGLYIEKSPMIADYCYLLLPLTFFALYMTVFETNASILQHIALPKAVREVGVRAVNLVSYLLYGHGVVSLDVFVMLFVGAYGLAMVVDFVYLLRLGGISFKIDWHFIDRRLAGEMVRYTLFMTATVLAANIPLINSLFLGAQAGLALTGVYTIAFYIANIVEVPYRSLGAIARPVVAEAVGRNDLAETNRLARQVSLHQFLVSSMIFCVIWLNLRAMFAVIPNGADYAGGMGVVLLLSVAKIVNSSLSIATDILNFSRRYAYSLIFIALLTVSAIVLNRKLIPLWSINGSAAATLCSYALYFGGLLLYLWFTYGVSLFAAGHLKVLAIMAAVLAADWLWNFALGGAMRIVAGSLLKTLVLGSAALAAVYFWRVSPTVNEAVDKALRRKKA